MSVAGYCRLCRTEPQPAGGEAKKARKAQGECPLCLSEIVIVDFGSDEPIGVQQFQSPDKIKIVRVDNSDRWRIGLAINIGVVFSTSDRICKFDSDIALVDDGALAGLDTSDKFYRGDWRGSVSNGQVIFEKAAWKQVGGYNESHTRLEDLELFHRTRRTAQFAALPTTVLVYRFRTFSYQQWAHEEQLRAAITNTSVRTGVLAYARYRIAVAAQRAGVAMTRSRRRS